MAILVTERFSTPRHRTHNLSIDTIKIIIIKIDRKKPEGLYWIRKCNFHYYGFYGFCDACYRDWHIHIQNVLNYLKSIKIQGNENFGWYEILVCYFLTYTCIDDKYLMTCIFNVYFLRKNNFPPSSVHVLCYSDDCLGMGVSCLKCQ